MKNNHLLCLLAFATHICACKKDDPSNTPNAPDSIVHFQSSSLNKSGDPIIVPDPEHDKIYYFGGTINSMVICYDYVTRKEISRMDAGYVVEPTAIAFGKTGGRREIFLVRNKHVDIFDALTLEKVDSIEIFPPAHSFYIRSIASNNKDIIFVSPYNNVELNERGVRAYNRLAKSFVSKSQGIDPNTIIYAHQKSDNTTEVLSFGRGHTPEEGVSIDIFDQQGQLSSTVNSAQVDNFSSPFVRTSGNCDYFISNSNIYTKTPLQQAGMLPGAYRGFAFDSSGNKIYALATSKIDVIIYPSLAIEKSIDLPSDFEDSISNQPKSFSLFFDDGKLIIGSARSKTNQDGPYQIFWITILKV